MSFNLTILYETPYGKIRLVESDREILSLSRMRELLSKYEQLLL